jgi:hypothetical protein
VNEADKASLIATVVRSLVAAMKRTWPAALPKRNANMHVGPDPPLPQGRPGAFPLNVSVQVGPRIEISLRT